MCVERAVGTYGIGGIHYVMMMNRNRSIISYIRIVFDKHNVRVKYLIDRLRITENRTVLVTLVLYSYI